MFLNNFYVYLLLATCFVWISWQQLFLNIGFFIIILFIFFLQQYKNQEKTGKAALLYSSFKKYFVIE